MFFNCQHLVITMFKLNVREIYGNISVLISLKNIRKPQHKVHLNHYFYFYSPLGSAVSWNLVESLRYNLMTVIIIGVCGVMFVISLIVAVIVISHRVMSTSPPAPDLEGKHSPASHHHLLYDQVKSLN